MPTYNYDRAEVDGFPYVTLEISPTITGITSIEVFYSGLIVTGAAVIPSGSRIVIGFRISVGSTPVR